MESEQENLDAGNIEKALELETQPPIEHPIVLQQKRDNEHAGENFDKVADNVAEIADEVDEVKLPQPISEYSNSLGRVPPKPPSVKELVATLPEFKSAPEMTQIASLNYTLESKFYYCGFVYKVNCLGADGNPLFKKVFKHILTLDF